MPLDALDFWIIRKHTRLVTSNSLVSNLMNDGVNQIQLSIDHCVLSYNIASVDLLKFSQSFRCTMPKSEAKQDSTLLLEIGTHF